MQPNHVIRNKEELLNHFGSSKQLEIGDLKQIENLLRMNIPPEIWGDAFNRNLLFFKQELVQGTKEVTFDSIYIKHIFLISFLTNLTELSLYNNKISDISAVSKLKNLKKLDLSSNLIEDISALKSLTNLTHLYLYRNKLTSYNLALPNLEELELQGNQLQDKSGLQHSPKLKRLNLSETEIIDLQISDLGINQQLLNIGPLKFCTQLTELNISETSISDIWPLQFMKNLKTLNMDNTKVIDLHPLQHLNQLEYITAHDACILDVSPLSKLTQLNSLDFSFNKITNAEPFKHHKNFSQYNLSLYEAPTTYELKFYSKILSVHNSHKQIRTIQNYYMIIKFRTSLTLKKNAVETIIQPWVTVFQKWNNQVQYKIINQYIITNLHIPYFKTYILFIFIHFQEIWQSQNFIVYYHCNRQLPFKYNTVLVFTQYLCTYIFTFLTTLIFFNQILNILILKLMFYESYKRVLNFKILVYLQHLQQTMNNQIKN
ncbi:Conserved_hypothetical protein [Hexamita inflata]|uniref:Uncharacterized protein n=1 Tax=Hexamita inflata TaxID=28002 RepID=A0AA86N8H9_9EUKA|nr:Conserved hypothetical protein [Hexamita inflata]